jgi:hypothetical protein
MMDLASTGIQVRPAARPIQNCAQCRKRKIKCNKTYPCAPCLLRGEGDLCREVEKNNITSKPLPESTTLDAVLSRLSCLEDTVHKLVKFIPNAAGLLESLPPLISASASSSAMRMNGIGGGREGEGSRSLMRPGFGASTKEEEAAMMLEDFAMANRINRARAARAIENDTNGTTSFSAPDGRTYRSPSYLGAGLGSEEDETTLTTSFDTHPLSMVVDSNVNIWMRTIQLVPSEDRCRALLDFYFSRLDWYSRVLHSPTFLHQSEMLLNHLTTLRSHPSPQNNQTHVTSDPTVPPPNITVSSITLWIMVLCLAFHLIEPQLCERLGYTMIEAGVAAKRLYSAVQTCLYHQDFMANHSLEHLQTIILMGVYQQNLDEADSHWALLGSAIKIAQNLGLSRLGAEKEGRRHPEQWKSVIRRETARRIWWFLVFDDWSHAAAHNGTYSIHPTQNHTDFPANVDDVDIAEGKEVHSKPMSEYTEMTFFLCRLRFVTYYREIVDHMNVPVAGYQFVLDMDKKLASSLDEFLKVFNGADVSESNDHDPKETDEVATQRAGKRRRLNGSLLRYRMDDDEDEDDSTPTQFNGDNGRVIVKDLELTLVLIMGETRRLRLHRPYLFRGYKDPKFAKSRVQCVESARTIVNLLKSDDEQSAILLKWWIVLFYGFAAAVVLFIDLCHHKSDGADLALRRAELQEALALFKTAEHVSAVSRNAIALLEGLVGAEPELSSKPAATSNKKRSAPSDGTEERDQGPFEQIVKRIIVDASKSIGSPSMSQKHSSPPTIPSPINSTSSYSPTASQLPLHSHPASRSSSGQHASPANVQSIPPSIPNRRQDYDSISHGRHLQQSQHQTQSQQQSQQYTSQSTPPNQLGPANQPAVAAYGMHHYGSNDSPQQQSWQYENPFAPRWDLSLLGFPSTDAGVSAAMGADGVDNTGVAGGMQFPDMSDASMAELSQLLLGFSGGSMA